MNRLIFNIIIYENQYMDEIKENWRVEVNSYEGVAVVCKQNSPVRFRLAVPGEWKGRRMRVWASSSEVSFQGVGGEGVWMAEEGVTVLAGQAVNPRNEKMAVLVHLVDVESGERVYGWRVGILPWSTRTVFG